MRDMSIWLTLTAQAWGLRGLMMQGVTVWRRARGRRLAALVVGVALAVGAMAPAQAQSTVMGMARKHWTGDNLTVEAYTGMLTGQLQEYVLVQPGNNSVSRLDWRLNTPVVGGTLSFRPFDRLTVQIGGFTNVSSGRGSMDDWDWLTPGQNLEDRVYSARPDWSDWSNHPDTRVAYARMIDANLRYELWRGEALRGQTRVSAIGGFRNTLFGLASYGGPFIASWDGFRADSGSFNDGDPVIGYAQNYYLPYLGLGTSWQFGRFSLDADVIGTLYGFGNERDNHVQRSIEFRSYYTNIPFVGGKLTLGYKLDDRYTLFGRVDYQHMFFSTADVTMTNYGTGKVTYHEDNAGLNAQTMVIAVGLKAKLN